MKTVCDNNQKFEDILRAKLNGSSDSPRPSKITSNTIKTIEENTFELVPNLFSISFQRKHFKINQYGGSPQTPPDSAGPAKPRDIKQQPVTAAPKKSEPKIKFTFRKVKTLNAAQLQALFLFQDLGYGNLNSESPLEEIKKAYRLLAKKHHPDIAKTHGNFKASFSQISAAYKELTVGF